MNLTHGERRAYARGCRCVACRAANAAYVQAHRVPLGLLAADAVRVHLQQLAAQGCGIRQIARHTGVSAQTVAGIRSGRRRLLRASTATRLMAATSDVAPGALVAATKSWRFLDSLKREGFTRRALAWHLGARSQQLQLAKRSIRAHTAQLIAKLYHKLAVA